jgi:hypothetical protein
VPAAQIVAMPVAFDSP